MKITDHRKNRPAIILIAILLLFGLPLLGAFLMTQEKMTLSSHTTNHGQLIQPPQDFAQLALHQMNGKPVTPDQWKGKWLMVFVNTQPLCDAVCEQKLYYLRQIKTATGKESARVERVILTVSGAPPDPHLAHMLSTDFAGTLHFVVSKENFSHNPHLKSDGYNIYLVDPLGNIMMMYAQDSNPMGMLKDLTRLLKLSHIG